MDETTFRHCCEFAYIGDYSVPPGPVYGNRDIDHVKECLFNRNNFTSNLFHPQLLPHFYDILERYTDMRPTTQPACTDPANDYAEILLCHARIHRYAFRSDCAALCVLSLKHITNLLEGLVLGPQQTKDVVRFLEFVYEESEFMDNLQHILGEYMVWNIEVLMQDAAFLNFLDASPDLEKMIFRRMWVQYDIPSRK
ncbi:uncharacterized protein BDW70DRAFT_145062 [Aspergillus foveolatus]|uniref:uncharacterized protein n=1 Tax=Aspergillus foveolatus TaxID=210207 RepID=UPI003CCD901A